MLVGNLVCSACGCVLGRPGGSCWYASDCSYEFHFALAQILLFLVSAFVRYIVLCVFILRYDSKM